MLENISKVIRCEMPVASAVFYGAATLVAGRKFCVAAGYKFCAAVAELTGRKDSAEWNKASAESLSLAKKDAIRDLTAVTGFIGLLTVGICTAESLFLEKEKSMLDTIKENPWYYGSGMGIGLLTLTAIYNRCSFGTYTERKYSEITLNKLPKGYDYRF